MDTPVTTDAGHFNRRFFFSFTREYLFAGKLRQSQVDGLSALLDAWEAAHATEDDRWLAYMLGTAHHETGQTLRPLLERGGTQYLRRRYDVTGDEPERARRHGNTQAGDGVRYAGRGLVQLTWKNNYRRAGKALGINLVEEPGLALEPSIARQLLFRGMMEGWYTGRRLADFFNAEREDWRNARRVINGLDQADRVAEYAQLYYAALSYTV